MSPKIYNPALQPGKNLTAHYTLQQIAYWAAAAGLISFATAFLLEKGFAPSQVGILLASGNLLSCAFQPLLAQRADRIGGNILNRLTLLLTGLCITFLCVVQFAAVPQWLYGLCYLLAVFSFDAMMPLLNSVCVAYKRQGNRINYGFGRGIGSLAYSFAALGIGKAIAGLGADSMVWIVLVLLMFNVIITLRYPRIRDFVKCEDETKAEDCCSIAEFFLRYKWYCASLLGVMLLAMFHAMTENYMIEIVGKLGGDSSSVGIALFVATAIEALVVIYFEKIREHISDSWLLKYAGLSFLLKSVLLLLAPSVTAIYFIQLLQATSYSFLAPTQMYYANAKVSVADMVKGQAFITAAYSLGCAIGNFTGGQLLDIFNVTVLMIAGIVMAALGTIILFITVDK
ncbi:MAG: MFS transporter [Oscillospiraceae bacterium]|nr:MFS transporter [Oscillospiraceae bacterium]